MTYGQVRDADTKFVLARESPYYDVESSVATYMRRTCTRLVSR
jgi:hypothetical protein